MEGILRAAAHSYQIPAVADDLLKAYPPLILTGVTAAGKNTLSSILCQAGGYRRLVTYTTRPPRGNERSGVDYWFLEHSVMFECIKHRTLIETQVIHDFVYGSPLEGYLNIVKSRQQPIMTIDVHGAIAVSRLARQAKSYFLIPPSFDEWMRRLGSRDFLSDGERNRRLHSAADEISTALDDKSFVFVVSEDMPQTAKELLDGLLNSSASQATARQSANELYEYIRNQ